jgi:predicted CopG family antitoxin
MLAVLGALEGAAHAWHHAYMHTTKQQPHKRMTISIDADVYDGLVRVVGRRKISQFIEDLARPHVVGESLESAYAAMAADEAREADSLAWSEGLISDVADASR